MPSSRDLPGFYYDSQKNRYFPIMPRGGPNQRKSQFIQQQPPQVKNVAKPSPNIDAKVLRVLFDREIGNACTSSAFQQRYTEAKASKPWLWSYGATSCADGAVEEFCACIQTNEGLKRANMITWGNSKGFVGVSEVVQSGVVCDGNAFVEPECIFPPSAKLMSVDTASPPYLLRDTVSRFSRSKITSIRKLRNIKEGDTDSLIFTTLGSGFEGGALHLLEQQQVLNSFGQLLPLESTKWKVMDCSVWTAAYVAADTVTLGTSRGAALVHLETSGLKWLIHSKSAVLSQECDLMGNLVFCGFRNGYISMVDMRTPSSKPKRMPSMQIRPETSSSSIFPKVRDRIPVAEDFMHSRKKRVPFQDVAAEVAKNFCESMRMNSAVCSLVLLRSDESYLLASAMNGDIYLWDRRLLRRGPVLRYVGNQNSHLPLCLGVDSSESLLASGGEDSAVRIWSLRSGKLLQTISKLPAIVHNFSTPGSNSCFMDHSGGSNHAWKMWLGSSAGVMYLHG